MSKIRAGFFTKRAKEGFEFPPDIHHDDGIPNGAYVVYVYLNEILNTPVKEMLGREIKNTNGIRGKQYQSGVVISSGWNFSYHACVFTPFVYAWVKGKHTFSRAKRLLREALNAAQTVSVEVSSHSLKMRARYMVREE